MTKEEFSKKILKCSYNLFSQALAGTRNLGYRKARTAAMIFDTDIEVWIDPSKQPERIKAWNKFNS